MGVYIKGMELPRHCTECPFWHGGIWEHCVLDENIQNDDVPEMTWDYPALCPLTEIPEPHGRLIDGDVLLEESKKDGAFNYVDSWQIADAPTIIERSE